MNKRPEKPTTNVDKALGARGVLIPTKNLPIMRHAAVMMANQGMGEFKFTPAPYQLDPWGKPYNDHIRMEIHTLGGNKDHLTAVAFAGVRVRDELVAQGRKEVETIPHVTAAMRSIIKRIPHVEHELRETAKEVAEADRKKAEAQRKKAEAEAAPAHTEAETPQGDDRAARLAARLARRKG